MNKLELLAYKPEKKVANYAFSLKAVLGRGSYGTVYLGRHVITDELAAIKIIDKSTMKDQVSIDNLAKEIDIMTKLTHPFIVKLVDVFNTVRNTYVIMEYCNGGDLKQYLSTHKKIPEEQAIRMLKNIIAGLKEIVTSGYIHRDLKPANIVLHNDICKISDFGFSRESESIMESLVGTPLYMSPQIINRQPYTDKCDIWSLGLIYYEMLYGVSPYHATTYPELLYKLANTKLVFPNTTQVSKESIAFIEGCLKKEEINRFQWRDVFNHILIKPRMSIFIEQAQFDIIKPHFVTHRPPTKSTLPGITRDRSCSTHYKKLDAPISSQSTECEDNQTQKQQELYYVSKPQSSNNRRTRSQLENIKSNITEIAKKPNVILQEHNLPKPCRNITNIFGKKKTIEINHTPQLLQLLLKLEEESNLQKQDQLVSFAIRWRVQLINKQLNNQETIQIANRFLMIAQGKIKQNLMLCVRLLECPDPQLMNEIATFITTYQ